MTRKEALQALLAHIEAGSFPADTAPSDLGLLGVAKETGLPIMKTMHDAFSGSLDAAKALHETVLDYGWGFEAFHLAGEVVLRRTRPADSHYGFADGEPARAWLITILKALIAEASE